MTFNGAATLTVADRATLTLRVVRSVASLQWGRDPDGRGQTTSPDAHARTRLGQKPSMGPRP